MLQACLNHFASEEQLAAFNDDGLLVVEDALPPQLVPRLNVVIDRIDAEERLSRGIGPHEHSEAQLPARHPVPESGNSQKTRRDHGETVAWLPASGGSACHVGRGQWYSAVCR